jgi:RHS repeat-associated protein
MSNNSTFKYDGDGNRVYAATADATTLHPFPMVEYRMETTPVAVKYYMAGSQRVAMREGTTAYYFLQDHLGSTALTLDSSGVKVGETRYDVWGKPFWQDAPMHTNRLYTGQLWDGKVQDEGTGLYFYNARYYDPALGRFTQADTIVPNLGNPL